MKKVLGALVVTSLISFSTLNAMNLEGETLTPSKVYKPTRTAVQKAMRKMGYDFIVDKDGDLKIKIGKQKWNGFVIFDTLSSGKVWNLKVFSQFATKESHYDELLEYCNNWNRDNKFPKLLMKDKTTLRIIYNYPVEYGFNPDEFEENVIGLFKLGIDKITDDIYAAIQSE